MKISMVKMMKNRMMMKKVMNKITKEQGSFFTKNQVLQVQVVDMSYQGYGVAKVNDFVIFIKGLLLDEVASIRLVKVFKTYAYAIIEEMIESSNQRVIPRCSVYDKCGGCDLMHLNYQGQQEFKQQVIKEQLTLAHLDNVIVYPPLSMDDPWYYRNKVATPIATTQNKQLIGFYRQNSHDIIEFDICHVQSSLQNRVIQSLRMFLSEHPIDVLRHVVMRQVYNPDELMIGLVSHSKNHPMFKQCMQFLVDKHHEIKSIILNINDRNTNTIFGKKDIVLYGKDHIVDRSLGLNFKVSLRSFFQVNTPMMNVLYTQAIIAANIQKNETVLDLYCGIGTLALLASKHAKQVYGVEINEKAIADAKENTSSNQITNVTFNQGDVKDMLSYFAENNIECDVVMVDPPRAGLHQHVINTIVDLAPKRLVYVSCNPTTLCRDLKVLFNKYHIEYVQPVDLFGQTHHIESVVLLTKR